MTGSKLGTINYNVLQKKSEIIPGHINTRNQRPRRLGDDKTKLQVQMEMFYSITHCSSSDPRIGWQSISHIRYCSLWNRKLK
jgi:hypothetical protein